MILSQSLNTILINGCIVEDYGQRIEILLNSVTFTLKMTFLTFLVIFSTISFLFFGISCFFTEHMRNEFIRYGLSKQLKLVGSLQIAGAIGIGIGYFYYPLLSIIAALGLSLLMIMGFGVRLKIKDPFIKSSPSIIYALINAYISIAQYYSL